MMCVYVCVEGVMRTIFIRDIDRFLDRLPFLRTTVRDVDEALLHGICESGGRWRGNQGFNGVESKASHSPLVGSRGNVLI